MAILRYNYDPFNGIWRDLNPLQKEMNRLFDYYFNKGNVSASSSGSVYPPVNIFEDSNNQYVTAELPGVDPKDIDIQVEGDSLVIKGERKIDKETTEGGYHRKERVGGTFNKKIHLPTRIASDKVTADISNGVLTISLPKAEEAKPRCIQIKAS